MSRSSRMCAFAARENRYSGPTNTLSAMSKRSVERLNSASYQTRALATADSRAMSRCGTSNPVNALECVLSLV